MTITCSEEEEDRMNYKLIITLILAGLALLFIIQNVAVVEIQFLFWSARMPRAVLMFLFLAAGIIIGWFLHSYLKYRQGISKLE
jgi:uncharacterized integral membrane protein